jgi:transcriptional regulator with GAF, ATPase, and Fis domain
MERVMRLAQKAARRTSHPDRGRIGRRQGTRRARHPGHQRAARQAVRHGQLRRHPDNLVESILFGHEKGSFTGATEKHAGKFVEAHTGTLFLDEIGDLPLDVQVKLLRAVQDGEVDPVGGRSDGKGRHRLISATHRNLLQQVKDGKFREDLFYRLNVYPIVVPPLRDRRDDIPQLVRISSPVPPARDRRIACSISAARCRHAAGL